MMSIAIFRNAFVLFNDFDQAVIMVVAADVVNGAKIRQTEFLGQEVRILDGRIAKFFDDGNRNADQ